MRHVAAWRVTSGSAVLALGTVIGGTTEAAGPVYTVNSTADVPDAVIDGICGTGGTCNGVPCCTLRAAIMEANFDFSGQEVTINLPAGTYTLLIPIGVDNQSDGDLNLYGKVKIVGAGFDRSIIDANSVDRAMFIGSSATVTLSDLRVQGGLPPYDTTRYGHGDGGGIYNDGGALALVRCLVRANAVAAGALGGGIYSVGGSLSLDDSMVRINSAPGGFGGGICAVGSTTTITRSAVYSNSADPGFGGGVFQNTGSLQVTNSTISSNVASFGGGMYFATTTAKLNNATVVANSAIAAYPAGSEAVSNATQVLLSNSIFGLPGPALGAEGDVYCGGDSKITSNDFNAIHDPGDCVVSGAVLGHTPYLPYPLALNGGLTVTYAESVSSYSVDAGDPQGCLDALGAPLATDQRGVKREIGAACDLGAFEVEPIGDANGDGVVDVADVFYLVNFLFAGGPVPKGRANVNGDPATDASDVFYLVNFLFAGGQPPQ